MTLDTFVHHLLPARAYSAHSGIIEVDPLGMVGVVQVGAVVFAVIGDQPHQVEFSVGSGTMLVFQIENLCRAVSIAATITLTHITYLIQTYAGLYQVKDISNHRKRGMFRIPHQANANDVRPVH